MKRRRAADSSPDTAKLQVVTIEALQADKRANAAKQKARLAKAELKAARKAFKTARTEFKAAKKLARKVIKQAKAARKALQVCLDRVAKRKRAKPKPDRNKPDTAGAQTPVLPPTRPLQTSKVKTHSAGANSRSGQISAKESQPSAANGTVADGSD